MRTEEEDGENGRVGCEAQMMERKVQVVRKKRSPARVTVRREKQELRHRSNNIRHYYLARFSSQPRASRQRTRANLDSRCR
jgi:hypothetical protein